MASVLLLDNYDSFTYNVLHLMREVTDADIVIKKNDEIGLEEAGSFDAIVISPGPDIPDKAGITKAVVQTYFGRMPLLGICLGHQAIGEVFGAALRRLEKVCHGFSSDIILSDDPGLLFANMPPEIRVGRYHSWVIDEKTMPECLRVTSKDTDGQIMSLQHVVYPVFGMQFHPESYMTGAGHMIMANFMSIV